MWGFWVVVSYCVAASFAVLALKQFRDLHTADREAARVREADFEQGFSRSCAAANEDRFALQRVLIIFRDASTANYRRSHTRREYQQQLPTIRAFWRNLLRLVPARDCVAELAKIVRSR